MLDILVTGELSVKGNPTELELEKGGNKIIVKVEDIDCLHDIIGDDAKSLQGSVENFANCKSVEELEQAGANYFTREDNNKVTVAGVSLLEDGNDYIVNEIELMVTDFETYSVIKLSEEELNIICANLPQ